MEPLSAVATLQNHIDSEATTFIADGSKTLRDLYRKIEGDFGNRLNDIHQCSSKGEGRSLIRHACHRVAELPDGTRPRSFHENANKRVHPIGTYAGERKASAVQQNQTSIKVPIIQQPKHKVGGNNLRQEEASNNLLISATSILLDRQTPFRLLYFRPPPP